MHDAVDARVGAEGAVDRFQVSEVAMDTAGLSRHGFQMTLGEVVEHHDFVAATQQLLHYRGTDVTSTPGYEDLQERPPPKS